MNKTIFDIETTGLDREKDRIVEIALEYITPKRTLKKRWIINPERDIPKEVSEIHGITNEIAKAARPFASLAPELLKYFQDSVIITFSGNYFDVPFLLYEFERVFLFDAFKGCKFVDVSNVFRKLNPRTLEACYYSYCNGKFEPHRAGEDVRATKEILLAMIKEHPEELDGGKLEKLEELSGSDKMIDIAGYLSKDENGEIIFNFGKHRGKRLRDHRDYVNWILGSDFPHDTQEKIKLYLNPYKK